MTELIIRVLEAFGLTVVIRIPGGETETVILNGRWYKVTIEAARH